MIPNKILLNNLKCNPKLGPWYGVNIHTYIIDVRWIRAEQGIKVSSHFAFFSITSEQYGYGSLITTILPLESKRPPIINKFLLTPKHPICNKELKKHPTTYMHATNFIRKNERRKINLWAYKKEGNSLLLRKRLQWILFHYAPKPFQNLSALENLNPTSPPNLYNVMRASNVASKTGFADLLWETFLLL